MTARASTSVVTGAFGYTGKYIARRMLDQGSRVRTLTRTPVSRSPFGDRVEVRPLDFGDPPGLVASLEGADILYNTYWVRFATFIPKQGDVLQSQGTWEQTQTGTKSEGCDKQSRSLAVKDSARYAKVVAWSEEDQIYIRYAPGLVSGGCCHGDDA